MSRLSEMIANGTVTPKDLVEASDLVERAVLVENALAACKNTLVFKLGEESIHCYDYTDGFGEYHSWGTCSLNGNFECYSNWGGNHLVGKCNLLSFKDVYMAFDDEKFVNDLRRFLKQQIQKDSGDDLD